MYLLNNRLSDGRVIRPFRTEDKSRFTQIEMFNEVKGLIPAHETIMDVGEHDDSLNVSMASDSLINLNHLEWRTRRYGVYPRGFERDFDKQIGSKVVWIERLGEKSRRKISYTFEVPDVRHPNDQNKGLRQASGMLDFDIMKLIYNEATRTVSVSTDFNPETDVVIRDVMRQPIELGCGWALPDADGFPLRTLKVDLDPWRESDNPAIRYLSFIRSEIFEVTSTGWHGSVVRKATSLFKPGIYVSLLWYETTSISLVSREPSSLFK